MDFIRSILNQRRAEPGYLYPMGWIAWFGVTIPVLLAANQLIQNILFSLSIYTGLWVIGCVGTCAT